MPRILNTSTHPVDLASGRVMAPGEMYDGAQDFSKGHNKMLLESGLAKEVSSKAPRTTKARRPKAAAADEESGDENTEE